MDNQTGIVGQVERQVAADIERLGGVAVLKAALEHHRLIEELGGEKAVRQMLQDAERERQRIPEVFTPPRKD